MRPASSPIRKLFTISLVQGVVLAIAMVLGVVLAMARGGVDSLMPQWVVVPIQATRADASEAAALHALREAFPGDEVSIDDGEFRVVSTANARDVAKARAVIERAGFRSDAFQFGRDTFSAFGRMTNNPRNVALLFLAYPLVLLAAAPLLRRRLPSEERPRFALAPIVISGVGGGLALALIVEVLIRVAGALGIPVVEQPLVTAAAEMADGVALILMVLAIVVLAPIGEELFYRGWVFRWLAPDNVALAYVVSAWIFAVIHFNPAGLPAYFAYGLGLAALYRWSGSIWTPILAHATNNAIAVTMLLARTRG